MNANNKTQDACFNLFSWHKNNEGGLWLATEGEDESISRKRTLHPWVHYESDDDSELEETTAAKHVDKDFITGWLQASVSSENDPDPEPENHDSQSSQYEHHS